VTLLITCSFGRTACSLRRVINDYILFFNQVMFMTRKVFFSTFIMLMLLILVANLGRCAAFGSPHKGFGTTIRVVSPQVNATYTGDVALNVSIHFYIEDTVNSSIPPYQNIRCI